MANTVSFIIKLIDKMTAPLQKVGKGADAVFSAIDKSIDNSKRKQGQLINSMDQIQKKITSLKNTRGTLINTEDIRKTSMEIRKLETQLRKLENLPPRGFFNRLGAIGPTLRGLVVPAAIALTSQFGISQMLSNTKEFEKTGALYATKFGNQAAGKLTMTQDVAAKTPFEFKEIANATGKFKGRGFRTDEKALMRNSDLAVGLGGSYVQLAEAIMDLPLGQTRRLEELGVGVEAIAGTNKLRISYGGLTQEVEKNNAAVESAMDKLSKLPGIAGSSAMQMETLEGKFSNLGDKMQLGFATAGEALRPFIIYVVDGITSVIDSLTGFFNWVMTNQSMVVDLVKIFAYAITGLAVAYAYYEKAAILAWIAQMKLNLAFLVSPIGIVVISIAALAAGFVYAWHKVEGFRGAIMGIWESMKQLGNNILQIFMPIITNLMEAFSALQDGRWKDAAKFGAKAVGQAVTMPARIVGAFGTGEVFNGVGKAYSVGYAKGVGGFRADKARDGRSLADRLTNPNGRKLADMGGDGFSTKSAAAANGTGSGGGSESSSPKITTINFGPMSFNIKALAKGGDMASLRDLAREVSAEIAAELYDADVQFGN